MGRSEAIRKPRPESPVPTSSPPKEHSPVTPPHLTLVPLNSRLTPRESQQSHRDRKVPKVTQLIGVSLVVWFLLSPWGQPLGMKTGVFDSVLSH